MSPGSRAAVRGEKSWKAASVVGVNPPVEGILDGMVLPLGLLNLACAAMAAVSAAVGMT